MRQMTVTVGTLIERGKSLAKNEIRVFSFLEIRTKSGEIVRLNNAVFGNECGRGLVGNGPIALLHGFVEKAASKPFPNIKGLNYVYAIANAESGRQFDDVEQFVGEGERLRSKVTIGRWIGAATTVALGLVFANAGGLSGLLGGLFGGGIIGGGIYFMNFSSLASSASLLATREEVAPLLPKLQGLLAQDAPQEPIGSADQVHPAAAKT